MNTTTMLGVMADVARVADSYVSTLTLDDQIEQLMFRAAEARASSGDARRDALRVIAAAALVALHAHDAEAEKAEIEASQVCPSIKDAIRHGGGRVA